MALRSYSAAAALLPSASFLSRIATPLTSAKLCILACKSFLRSRMPCSVMRIGSSMASSAACACDWPI